MNVNMQYGIPEENVRIINLVPFFPLGEKKINHM